MKKYYYVTGNTAEGFVNFLPANVEGFNQIIILKHPSHTLKTAILKNIIRKYEDTYQLEVLLSSTSDQFLEGVIIRDKSKAVIIDHIATPDIGAVVELDLSLFLDKSNTIAGDDSEAGELFNEAYQSFSTGLLVHDKLEAIYIKEMNFDRADYLAQQLIDKLLQNQPKQQRSAHVYHRLFGTNTIDGVVNIIPHIIENIPKVVHVKGRAGTGKSTFMKKVLTACIDYGYDIELFHCSFDPHSIDMVLVHGLDFCIFDSTDPHEFFPSREGETIIDLYEETVTPGTDEKYREEIEAVHRDYKGYMKKGIQQMKKVGKSIVKTELHYTYNEKDAEKIAAFIIENSLD